MHAKTFHRRSGLAACTLHACPRPRLESHCRSPFPKRDIHQAEHATAHSTKLRLVSSAPASHLHYRIFHRRLYAPNNFTRSPVICQIPLSVSSSTSGTITPATAAARRAQGRRRLDTQRHAKSLWRREVVWIPVMNLTIICSAPFFGNLFESKLALLTLFLLVIGCASPRHALPPDSY